MDRYRPVVAVANNSMPTEAWLFAQVLLGRPIPPIVGPEAKARAERQDLECRAAYSPRHAAKLRSVQAAETEARRKRAVLEWAAQISPDAEAELQKLRQRDADLCDASRRVEQFYESYCASLIEWNEADHPRRPKGSSAGGQWVAKGGGGSAATSQHRCTSQGNQGDSTAWRSGSAELMRDFDKGHDLALRGAFKNGKLPAGDIPRIKFTDDEIKQILQSAKKSGSDLNLTFYTAQNLPAKLRAAAERDFADLPGDEKYAMQAYVSNQRRARVILMARNPAFQEYVAELYGMLRSFNPTHFTVEKGVVVATGKEPVLGGEASRLDALKEMLIYLALMKGVSWGTKKIANIMVGPQSAGEITIAFEGGGKLNIRGGAKYDPEALGSAVERAAAGENITIDPPTPRASPRPSLTEIPRIHNSPREFRRWFNELTPEELAVAWRSPKLKKIIGEQLRWPGGQHEWLMVSRANKFKEWGITAEQIAEMRTPISKVRFKNPTGGHKGEGAATTHNQILKIIDSSPDFPTFRTRLQEWANERLVGGAAALPPGLRP